ncbi:MAG: peptidase M4 [Magnetococcales bacterium]|nr:peptidase M4 [Magnetococcales bacterium]
MVRPVLRTTLLCVGAALTGAYPACAADTHHPDHEMARRLVQSGAILPLERILEQNRKMRRGVLLDVELETKHGVYLYEIEMVDSNGQVTELRFNARTGDLLQEKQK